MTDTTTDTQDTDTAPQPEAAVDAEREVGEGDRPGAEAARYRRRLREAEAERDVLAGQLEANRRRVAEHYAAASLVEPGELFRDRELVDLLDDDGAVDPEKVASATAAILEARPHLAARRTPKPDPSQGARGSVILGDPWQDAFAQGHGKTR